MLWVTLVQVSRSHSPVFDLTVRHLDEVYLQNQGSRLGKFVISQLATGYLFLVASAIYDRQLATGILFLVTSAISFLFL